MSTLFLATSFMMHLLFFCILKLFRSYVAHRSIVFPHKLLSLTIPIFAKFPGNNRFLPRDAMLSAVYAVVVCLCVCHTPVLYQNR